MNALTAPPTRVPVERLRNGDVVQAVPSGPRGVVTDADLRGWVLVEYHRDHPGGTMSYKRGKDSLLRCADPTDEDARA